MNLISFFVDFRHLQYPDKASVKVGVNALQIIEGYRLSKKLFIKRHRESTVEIMTVENRDAYDSPDKVKVRQVFLIERKTDKR